MVKYTKTTSESLSETESLGEMTPAELDKFRKIGSLLQSKRESFHLSVAAAAFQMLTLNEKVIAMERSDKEAFVDDQAYIRALIRYCDYLNVSSDPSLAAERQHRQPSGSGGSSSALTWDFRIDSKADSSERRRTLPWNFEVSK